MSVPLVLFDVDGTLLDVRGAGRWAMSRAFEEIFDIPDAEGYARKVRFDGLTDPDILLGIGEQAGIAATAVKERGGDLERAFLRHLEARLVATSDKRALPGVVELLDRLVGVHDVALALATGNARRGAMLKLESVGLGGYFQHGAFGGDAPDRLGIGRVARERCESILGSPIDPSRVVLIGDSVPDIESARGNGYRSVAVGTGWEDHEALRRAGPDLFLDDLTDFGTIMQFIFGSRG